MGRVANAVFRWAFGVLLFVPCAAGVWFLVGYLEVDWLPGASPIGVTVLAYAILWSTVMIWTGLGLRAYPRSIYFGPFWSLITFRDMFPVGLALATFTLVYLVWIVEKNERD